MVCVTTNSLVGEYVLDMHHIFSQQMMLVMLMVSRMLACARARTWIPVKWPRSLGVRLYAF